MGDSKRPALTNSKNSFLFFAIPPPDPPKVNEGLIIAGKPTFFKTFFDLLKELTISDLGKSKFISFIHFLNKSLSSALEIALAFAPINSTLFFFNIPFFSITIATFNAVCPPMVGKIAHGFSFFIIFSTISVVIGSI